MRVDAHQHFWRYDPAGYGWMGDGMDALKRDHLPADIAPHIAAHALDGSVAVQARQSLEETRFLLALARKHSRVLGVVGWVDLCDAEVDTRIAELAPDAKLVGVRHIVQDEPDTEFLLRDDFCRGVAALAEHGLTYDVLIFPRQLAAAIRFVELFPDQPFVLDHMAKPLIRDGLLKPWAEELRALAAHENVCCKLSGLVTEADWARWTPEQLYPYLDAAYEAFGPNRVMFGSDWPVCRLAAEYGVWFSTLEGWAACLGDDERANLFGLNAARFYGLPR